MYTNTNTNTNTNTDTTTATTTTTTTTTTASLLRTTPGPPTKSFPTKSPRVKLSGRLPINSTDMRIPTP